MVKKISAVVLALVLCLSVMILPATAAGFDDSYTFADGIGSAFKIELDKETYNAGDIVTVNVYARFADETRELKSGTMMFGVNSAQIDRADAFNAAITTATANSTWDAYWKTPESTQFAWQSNATIISRVSAACTTDAGVYDTYLKVAMAQDVNKVTDPKHGISAADLNADTDPFLSFQLKLRDDIPDGTPVTIGMPTGAVLSTPAQITIQFFNNPGVTTVSKADAAATYDVTAAAVTFTVGGTVPAGPAVDKSKAEVKMTPNSATTVEDAFTFRVTSVITDADWDAYFANTAVEGATANCITSLGFVAYKGTDGFDMDTAKAVAAGTAADGYDVARTTYVQKATDDADAYFGARVEITSAETRSDVTYIAFVEYLDADGQPATAFYEASYEALLNANYTNIVNSYLAAYPYAG